METFICGIFYLKLLFPAACQEQSVLYTLLSVGGGTQLEMVPPQHEHTRNF